MPISEIESRKIGVIGRSQGDLEAIRTAAKHLRRLGASAMFHLGNDYADAQVLSQHGMPVLKVPGMDDAAYSDPAIPNRRIELVENMRILLTHCAKRHPHDLPEDIDPVDLCFSGQVDVVCNSGASPAVEQLGQVVFLSPGTLARRDGAEPATFALIEIKLGKIRISICELESGETRYRKVYRIARLIG